MTDILQQDLISYDPLSEVTRKERRALLGFSLLGLALVLVPLVPTKIAAFGIEFASINRRTLIFLYVLLIVYYLIAFTIYAFSDLVAWRRSEAIRYFEYQRAEEANAPPHEKERLTIRRVAYSIAQKAPIRQPFATESPAYRGLAAWKTAHFASRSRAIFDFALPIIFSCCSLYFLIFYAVSLKEA